MGDVLNYLISPWVDPNRKRSAHGDSLFALDGVRGLAAMVVIASHAQAFGMLGQGRRLGVLLFFTLSGFVLALPFADRPEEIFDWRNVGRFFANRALRVVPIFAVAVLCIARLMGEDWRWIRINLEFAGGWTHLWSVAEEVRFYALFPLVIAALALLPSRGLRMTALIVMILIAWEFQSTYMIDLMIGEFAPFYFWFFLAGMLACFIYRSIGQNRLCENRSARLFFGSLAGIILLSIPLSSDAAVASVWRPLFPRLPSDAALWVSPEIWCGAFVTLLVSATAYRSSIASRFLQSYPVRQLGLMSYSLYLFHLPVLMVLERYHLQGGVLFIVLFATTYAIAVLSYLAVEKPFLMLKPKDSRKRMFQGDRSGEEPYIGCARKPASVPLSIGEGVDVLK